MLVDPRRFLAILLFATVARAAFPAAAAERRAARPLARVPRETVLYSFAGGDDGDNPYAGLVRDKSGALYGTTVNGGGSPACDKGCGTVFKLTPTDSGYAESVLYRFQGGATDGAHPYAGLLLGADGSLYGTTTGGGRHGTAFRLTPSGSQYTESIMHLFGAPREGAEPYGGLVADAFGVLYGTTAHGGLRSSACPATGCGVVFELTPQPSGYVENVVYLFRGGTQDGSNPYAGLVFGAGGSLYGTTVNGGNGNGTVYELLRGSSGYIETIVQSFASNGTQGAFPYGGLLPNADGELFGATKEGGAGCCGAVYELTPSGVTYTESLLYSFDGASQNGAYPVSSLIADGTGALYGTAINEVFKLTPSGSTYAESALHVFPGPGGSSADGSYPYGGLVLGPKRTLYGTTFYGGSATVCHRRYGCGTVFEVTQ